MMPQAGESTWSTTSSACSRRVDETRFEPVERLDAQAHATFAGVVGDGPQIRDQSLDAMRALAIVEQSSAPDRGVDRPGDDVAAQGRHRVDAEAKVVLRRRDDRRDQC